MTIFDFTDFGVAVILHRESLNVGLREAAAQAGVSASTLSRIEGGRIDDLNVGTLITVCDWMGQPPQRFFITGEYDFRPMCRWRYRA